MLLYLVRHGQTELNEQGIVQGHMNPPLSPRGEEQARKLGEWLKLVPFTEAWSSPLKRAEDTAKIICSFQPKVKLRTDERLITRGAGAAQGKRWEEIEHNLDDFGMESEEDLAKRLHDWLKVLVDTHTPISSTSATPISPLSPLSPSGTNLERALSSIVGLPRPGISRNPSTPAGAGKGSGIVLVVTHQECLSSLAQLLTATTDPAEIIGKSPIDIHVPENIDFGRQVGNTSVAILRVWWEDDGSNGNGMEARGRLEAWGSEDHLHEE
ncbi:uncharacterized protein IL334_000386 [Kwoniella shivajii]|uniref:Phosphoglycerate mutase n=1 Tax=Kwoniella shivajii TaxID=564305 RepID=A0ABZ1CPB1_9TREE|nr:hypothetical protein IL334_000386 [Kwoniella shivajii]